MDKKDEEEIKEHLKKVEFNNDEEDMKLINEEKEERKLEKKDKRKNTVIIALIGCVVVLSIILILVLTLGGSKESKKASGNSESGNGSQENEDNKNIKDEIDYNGAKVYYNKYIYVPNKSKKTITDLDGNVIVEADGNLYTGSDNSLYLVNYNCNSADNFCVKKVKDSKSTDIYTGAGTGLLVDKKTNNLLGIYKTNDNNDVLYLFNDDKYDTIELSNFAALFYGNSAQEDKYIYNGKYIITYEQKKENNYASKYGVYDIKAKKQLVDALYDNVVFLHDDVFVAVKGKKSGLINTNNKELLGFNYDSISYADDLYFVGINNKVHIFDKDLNNLNSAIEVDNLEDYSYAKCCDTVNPYELIEFKNNVIVEITNGRNLSEFVVVDKNGHLTSLGKGKIAIVDNYLVKSNDNDTLINMYDGSLKIQHTLDAGTSAIDLNNTYIYLNNLLIINCKRFFNLTNDTDRGTINTFRRTSQDYEVKIYFTGDTGKVTVSMDDVVLEELDNVPVNEFLKASNNGITITKNYFIYNAGGVIVIPKESPMVKFISGFDQ